MRTIVIVYTSANNRYRIDVIGRYGGGYSRNAGQIPSEVAAKTALAMTRYGRKNPEGADLMAPSEIIQHIPVNLHSIP